MVSAFDAIFSTILVVLLGDILFTFLIMLHIHTSAKSRWKKITRSTLIFIIHY